jgi:hypothetical protein
MKRRAVLGLTLCLTVAPFGMAGTPTDRFTISQGREYLAFRKGQLVLGRSTFGAVSDSKDAADRWYILGTQIKSSVGGGYLAYDPRGEDNAVVLRSGPGEGTEWNISVPGKGHRSEGEMAVIRVSSGPLKGCYLTVSAGRLVVAEDPPQKLQAARIFSHK